MNKYLIIFYRVLQVSCLVMFVVASFFDDQQSFVALLLSCFFQLQVIELKTEKNEELDG